ncbi:unnamed protein product [Rhodiola kirilowii]
MFLPAGQSGEAILVLHKYRQMYGGTHVSEEKAQQEISHFSIRRFVLSLIRYRKGDKVGSKMINLPPDSRGYPVTH